MAIQSATKENLKTFLSNIYYIPMNQREYSWEQAQLEDFWEDFKSVINNQDRKHFFGQIVIYDDNKKKKKYIINSINFHQISKNPRYRNGIGDLYIYASEI